MKTTTQSTLRKTVYAAVMIALAIILKFAEIPIGLDFRITLTMIPLMLAGMLLGPTYGFSVGMLADVLLFILKPDGNTFHIGFTLTNGLYGLIPGLIGVMLKKKNIDFSFKTIILTSFLCEVICSLILNNIFLSQLFGVAIMATLPIRIFKSIAMIVIESVVLNYLYKYLKQYVNSNLNFKVEEIDGVQK